MRASDSDDPIVAAHGIVHPANEGELIHNNPMNARYARVQVNDVDEAYAEHRLPIPLNDEIFTLGHAVGTFIEWLKEDIFLKVPDPTGMALKAVPTETASTRHQTILQIKEAPTSAPQQHGCDDEHDEVTSPGKDTRTMANLSEGNELEMMATKVSEASLAPQDDENPKGISPASVATKKTPSKRDGKKSKRKSKEKGTKRPVKYLSRPEVNLTTASGGCTTVRRILSNNAHRKSSFQFQLSFKPGQAKEVVCASLSSTHIWKRCWVWHPWLTIS